jgi:DNA-binding Lrp family transcriptional regulator
VLQRLEKKTVRMECAYIMINCDDDSQQFITEQLKMIDGVTETQGTFGSYDVIAKIETPSIETLREVIALRIRKVPKIRMTTTIVCGPSTFLQS